MNLHAHWTLDERLHLLRHGPACLHLTPIEWRLLHALLNAHGRTCPLGELLGEVQDAASRDVCSGAIDLHVRSLRCKIAALDPLGANIESVRNDGYRLGPLGAWPAAGQAH